MSAESLVRVCGVSMSYEGGKIPVLHEVDLDIARGSLVALCGPSGCGKSTLLHLMAGLDRPTAGEVFLHGARVTGERRLTAILRHTVGFVFQLHNLIPDLTLEENCLIPTVGAGMRRKEARARLHDLAERTGIAHRLGNRIQDLSGGERQRTALCRALMNDPQIILADEPTGALDGESRGQVFDLLLGLVRGDGRTLVMATHDRELAARCDRIVEMKDGRVTG